MPSKATATAEAAARAPDQADPVVAALAALASSDALIDGLPSGVVIIDREYRIRRVNRYTARWLKRAPAEMVGRHCYEVIHAREAPCQDCPCAVAFRTGAPATAVHGGLDAHGGATHAELVAMPIRDASGQVVLALESARDVSERVRHVQQLGAAVDELRASQQELRERNEELELLNGLLVRAGAARGLDAVLSGLLTGALQAVGGRASAAILLLDDAGRRLELAATQGVDGAFAACPTAVRLGRCACSQAALEGAIVVSAECTGQPHRPEPVPGEPFGRIAIPLTSGSRTLGVLTVHLPAGQRLPPGRERLFELLGREMGIAVENAQLFQRTDTQLHRKVAELTTALEAVERERARAQASERAKEEFVTMVAHDLRSPLSVIHSDSCEVGRTCGDSTCLASRESIRRAVRRADTMLTGMADSARLEAGGLELRREALDLEALVRELVESAFPVEQRGRFRLALAGPATVLGDRSWLERAVVNVIGNALKFAPPTTAVVVRLSTANGAARLEVADEGPGIPADDLPHLFARYFRASNARQTGGTGLGLYITRLVVEGLGGQASAVSELGRGTTVTLTLPAQAGAPPGLLRS